MTTRLARRLSDETDRIALFDVDGTLVRGAEPAHLGVLADAMERVTGQRPELSHSESGGFLGTTKLDGMIDCAIIRLALESCGLDLDEVERALPAVKSLAVLRYSELDRQRCGTLLPGARTTLTTLTRRGWRLGVLTGNLRGIALRKIAMHGLGALLTDGGFGDRGPARADLLAPALEAMMELTGTGCTQSDLLYIGDTPRDVAAAQSWGIRCVAVSTGPYSERELTEAGASVVIASLRDAADLFDSVLRRG